MKKNYIFIFLIFWALICSVFLRTTILHYVQSAEAAHGIEFELHDMHLKKHGNEGEIIIALKCINPSPVVVQTFQIRYLLYVNGRFIKSDAIYVTHTLPPGETVFQFKGEIHKYPMEYVLEAEGYGKMIWMLNLEIVVELPFKGLRLQSKTQEYWVM
ncbi:MAG: hypothetical protein PVF58_10860 [Candidatus Methanofastidiosia archaeon]